MRFVTKRTARQAASYALFVVATAVAALWAHSHQAHTQVGRQQGSHYRIRGTSYQGLLHFTESGWPEAPQQATRWWLSSRWSDDWQKILDSSFGPPYEPKAFTIDWVRRTGDRLIRTERDLRLGRRWFRRVVTLPHWFVTLSFLAPAIILRPAPRHRFTIREALALVSLAALMASGYAALSQLADAPRFG